MPTTQQGSYDEDPGGDEFHKGHAQRRRSVSRCGSCGGGGCGDCAGFGNTRTPTPSNVHGAVDRNPEINRLRGDSPLSYDDLTPGTRYAFTWDKEKGSVAFPEIHPTKRVMDYSHHDNHGVYESDGGFLNRRGIRRIDPHEE